MNNSKHVLLIILITVFFLTGCDEGPVPESNTASNNNSSPAVGNSSPISENTSNKAAPSTNASIQYGGPAIRYDFICLDKECTKCPNGGYLTLTLNADKTATLSHVGGCIAVGPKGCFTQAPDCGISLSGTYGNGGFNFTGCNDGKLTGEGKGSYDDKEASGSVTCKDSDGVETISTLDWENLSRLN